MLKISSNPKITVSAEMDGCGSFELKLSTSNCLDLNKRMQLARKLIDKLKSDMNHSAIFKAEIEKKELFP